MEAATPPSQLFHCLSALDIEEQPTPPSLTLLPVGRAVVASAEEAEFSASSSSVSFRKGGTPCWRALV